MGKIILTVYLTLFLLVTCQGDSETESSESAESTESGQKPPGEKKGPCIGMDCMHGVLMHNDEKQGIDHKAEDQYLRFKSLLETENPVDGPQDAESEYHGALMHGDDKPGQKHEENDQAFPEEKINTGPKDLNDALHELMHGEEGVHKHDWDKEEEEGAPSPPDEKQLMHGLLMHGDINHGEHDHSEGSVENTEPLGPMDAEKQLHGVLMHGDQEPGQHHEHDSESEDSSDSPSGPDPGLLHGILMHGDAQPGIDHSHDHETAVHDVFNDISKIMELELDEDLLKIIDIKNLLEKDQAEYEEFKANKPQHQDEPIMDSTYASVSDSILSDIELMKKRYLSKLVKDIDAVGKEGAEIDVDFDDKPFTAEDANAVLDAAAEPGEHEDIRHDIELIGSTDPINARHKMFQLMQEAKQKK